MRLSQDSHKIVTASIGDLENSLMNDDTRTRRASKAFRPRRPIAELAAVPSAEMIEIRCRLGPIQDEFYRLLKMWSALVISADGLDRAPLFEVSPQFSEAAEIDFVDWQGAGRTLIRGFEPQR